MAMCYAKALCHVDLLLSLSYTLLSEAHGEHIALFIVIFDQRPVAIDGERLDLVALIDGGDFFAGWGLHAA